MSTLARVGEQLGAAVKAIEPQRGSSHLIKVWGLNERMSIVAHVAPTLVVSHNEDEIGLFRAVANKGEESDEENSSNEAA